jgi:hypothetical protein
VCYCSINATGQKHMRSLLINNNKNKVIVIREYLFSSSFEDICLVLTDQFIRLTSKQEDASPKDKYYVLTVLLNNHIKTNTYFTFFMVREE